MKKSATTIEEQIEKLKQRGMVFDNEEKAKENLLDIGYYRLGFYWFPFEKTFPRDVNRTHELVGNTKFEYAIKLYYFDFDLRNVFLKYISRVEINFRTTLIYHVSNKYKENSLWYLDKTVVKESFLNSKEKDYMKAIEAAKKESVIMRDLASHRTSNAPAWKIIEFLSLGIVISLYENLKDGKLRKEISDIYGVSGPAMLTDYLHVIRRLRNSCAHGKVLFDFNLPTAISTNGPAVVNNNSKNNLNGAYGVLKFVLGTISENRVEDMKNDLCAAFDRVGFIQVLNVIKNNSGLTKEIL